ncbi:hypothetical protein VIN01S_19540 [Vibrio inusitatus NBRC 102082]|uniref:Uncharacterized protein n=1 Tax=Vibrio inusitatus NBRC 102082 TaxID=1219070 RepID=A0A4Y3HWQ1_9VIBR|nr:hypothetical protein [Vibrio inusitatus]GEA51150.1 hypothetical protein VIN01S_19540 [Vibrio inusitatus NBRC 102082]
MASKGISKDHENRGTFDSELLEEKILSDLQTRQTLLASPYPLNSTSIVLQEIPGTRLKERKLVFVDINDPTKAFLYRVVVAAYNYAYVSEFAPKSAKVTVERYAVRFVAWLNEARIFNRFNVLKEYEKYHFDLLGNHGGHSVLSKLMPILSYAYEFDEFRLTLTTDEAELFRKLKGTSVSPNLNTKQISLASYFGALDWLRRDDVGVGNQLYLTLASAKLTVNSLKWTASTIIIKLFESKVALQRFLVVSGFTASDFQFMDDRSLTTSGKKVHIGKLIYRLIESFHALDEKPLELRNALELLILSNVTNVTNFEKIRPALISNEVFNEIFHNKYINDESKFSASIAERNIKSCYNGNLLSMNVLSRLLGADKVMPITELEKLMFSWLMASLTVQPSDITKLSWNSFRRLVIGGRVGHIECEYFKGRSNAIHITQTLSTKKVEGKALLIYLEQHKNKKVSAFKGGAPVILNGIASIFGSLIVVFKLPHISNHLATSHLQNGKSPIIIPKVLEALKPHQDKTSNNHLFGLQSIKNSAVHAYADPYTLHYLINRNSHSNKTEKLHYLTQDNEEFINSSGRITRSIMIDLINNVFDLDFNESNESELYGKELKRSKNDFETKKAIFNNEFANVTDSISYKSEDMLSRLKVVTEQSKGVVNEVGILSFSNLREENLLPIYVLDSKTTVFKMLNYLNEFKKNYKKLLCSNPDYLYLTVFPYVEWIEKVLPKLSKKSIRDGEKLYNTTRVNGVTISVFHSL